MKSTYSQIDYLKKKSIRNKLCESRITHYKYFADLYKRYKQIVIDKVYEIQCDTFININISYHQKNCKLN